MKKYKVDFFIRYTVEADSENEARQIAKELFRSKLRSILANAYREIFDLFELKD